MLTMEQVLAAPDAGRIVVRFALLWLSHLDGVIGQDELALIEHAFPSDRASIANAVLVEILKRDDRRATAGLLTLLRGVVTEQDKREFVLQVACKVALADSRVAHSEVHGLRFLADLLSVKPERLAELYATVGSGEIPEPPDLSDSSFWERLEARSRSSSSGSQSSGGEQTSGSRSAGNAPSGQTAQALATLGLERGATLDEIKAAFRQLAAVHHPDRFVALGSEAAAKATKTFQRIKAAYDHLTALSS